LHLSKLDLKKFWRKLVIHKNKENNMIPLKDRNSYFKSLYKFSNAMDTIPNIPPHDKVFSMEDIELMVKQLTNGKLRTLKATKMKFLKSYDLSSFLSFKIS
jgi:hypothetical protein